MEDIARQLIAERNTLQEQVLKLTREAENAKNWGNDIKRLQAELRQQRDENEALQARIDDLERERAVVAASSRGRSLSLEIIEKPSRPHPLPRVRKTGGGTLSNAVAGSSKAISSPENDINPIRKQDVDMKNAEALTLVDSQPLPNAALEPTGPPTVSTALVPSPTLKRSHDGASALNDPAVGPHSKRLKRSASSEPSLSLMADSELPVPVPTMLRVSQAQNVERASGTSTAIVVKPTISSTSSVTQKQLPRKLRKDSKTTRSRNEQKESSHDQSNAEAKAESFSLPPSRVDGYLSSTPFLTITPPALCPVVPRNFVLLAYGGGSAGECVQLVEAKRNVSANPTPRMRRIFWPKVTMNPSMPRFPGAPGLVFGSRHDILHDGPWSVFCPNVTNGSREHKRWTYLGEYESEIVGQLTAEEFRSQGANVKAEWGKQLTTRVRIKNIEIFLKMRSRIGLRKSGDIPSGNDAKDNGAVATEMSNVIKFGGSPVDKADVIRAFERGEERINIIRMKCVSYDHVFANDMKKRLEASAKRTKPAKSSSSKKGKSKEAQDAGKASRPPTSSSMGTASAMATGGARPGATSSLRRSDRARVPTNPSFNISAMGNSGDSSDSDIDSDSSMSGNNFDCGGTMPENRNKGKGVAKNPSSGQRNQATTTSAPPTSTSRSQTGSASQEAIEVFSDSEV
ncbi:hypothetical protein BKA70DRAFT_744804 [Coprinopsis sp. MPI-PUGE-AT-0042]|nr:hypothetical protein BKA70DRAFT_744804 [Coprinopsis sp. MPI-PUGE-AT-0042]